MRRPRASLAAAALAAAVSLPAGADAQWRSSLWVGAGRVENGLQPASAFLVRASFQVGNPHADVAVAGSMARFADGGTDAYGSLSGELRTGRLGPWSAVAVGTGRGVRFRGFEDRWRMDLQAGPRLALGEYTLHLRAGGSVYTSGEAWDDALLVGAEARRAWGPATFRVGARHTAFSQVVPITRDTVYYVGGFPFRGSYTELRELALRYTDLEGSVRIDGPLGSALELSGGARGGDAFAAEAAWGRVSASVPLTRTMEVVAEAGRRAELPEERLPGGRFATVGIRLVGAPRRPLSPPPPPPGAPTLQVLSAPGGMRTLRLAGVAADSVEVLADFTSWNPVAMVRAPTGGWEATLHIPAGSHRLCLRVDGGPCAAPPGLPTARDEFEGTVGILLVEP